MNDYRIRLKNINTFIFDYDGVLSDGKILFTDDGQQIRNGNVKDGYAIQLAQKLGYKIIIISGASTFGIKNRCNLLNIKDTFLNSHNKIEIYENIKIENNLIDKQILYMGDDIPDFQVMLQVGISCCPSDATIEIKKIAHYISNYKGGEGCVRDIIEQVLRSQNKWMTLESYTW